MSDPELAIAEPTGNLAIMPPWQSDLKYSSNIRCDPSPSPLTLLTPPSVQPGRPQLQPATGELADTVAGEQEAEVA